MAGTPFVVPKTVRLDAAGEGQVEIGPAGQDWVTSLISVSTSTAVKKPLVSLYKGGISTANLLEDTYGNDAYNDPVLLQPGELLYVTWAGGDVGATATLRVAGKSYPAGQGAAAS